MSDRVQLTPSALISGIGDMLKLNPLLVSLFAISPADALEHLGVGQASGWIEARRATSTVDRAQVALLLDALNAGLTSLDLEPEMLTVLRLSSHSRAARTQTHDQSQARPSLVEVRAFAGQACSAAATTSHSASAAIGGLSQSGLGL